MESASRKTAGVAAKADPKPADRAPSKPADTGSPEPADMATPEPADMATPEPAYRAPSKSADRGSAEPADRAASKAAYMASPKSAARSGDEITPNPTYVTASATKASATKASATEASATKASATEASATKAPSEPSTPRRREVYRRPGQGTRKGKNCGCVQYRTQWASSRHRIIRWRSRSNWRVAECGRLDCGLESVSVAMSSS
jgi:hypothetical protein